MMTYAITSVVALAILALFLRGGALHNYLVFESEGILQGAGFETYQEHPKKLPDGGLDFVDLLAEKEGFVVCIEVETSARYVLTNAAKAEQLGLPLIVVVPTRKVKKSVQNKLYRTDIRPGGHDIYILLLTQLKQEVTNSFSLFSSVSSHGKTNNKSN
jgi:hypothetical protein